MTPEVVATGIRFPEGPVWCAGPSDRDDVLVCTSVADGARTSKITRMFSNPTAASFDIPKVPCKSKSPSTVTSMPSVGIPIAAATIWQVI